MAHTAKYLYARRKCSCLHLWASHLDSAVNRCCKAETRHTAHIAFQRVELSKARLLTISPTSQHIWARMHSARCSASPRTVHMKLAPSLAQRAPVHPLPIARTAAPTAQPSVAPSAQAQPLRRPSRVPMDDKSLAGSSGPTLQSRQARQSQAPRATATSLWPSVPAPGAVNGTAAALVSLLDALAAQQVSADATCLLHLLPTVPLTAILSASGTSQTPGRSCQHLISSLVCCSSLSPPLSESFNSFCHALSSAL